MKGFSIRNAGCNDTALILTFIRELAEYEGLQDEVVCDAATLEQQIFDFGGAKVLIAEYDKAPIGFALYFYNFSTFLGRRGIYLEDLYITKKFRGNGYGKALLCAIADEAAAKGLGRVEWWCLDENKPSIEFYKSIGAKPMDEWTVFRLDGDTLRNFRK